MLQYNISVVNNSVTYTFPFAPFYRYVRFSKNHKVKFLSDTLPLIIFFII